MNFATQSLTKSESAVPKLHSSTVQTHKESPTMLTTTVSRNLRSSGLKIAARNFGSTNVCSESYSEKQAKLGRPVSPHVTIYKFPVTALTSITNRVTGVALSAGITGIGALALGGVDVGSLMSTIGSITVVGHVAKFAVSFPLVYHYLGGIRHLMWDRMPEMLENAKVEQSSYALVGASATISVALALI